MSAREYTYLKVAAFSRFAAGGNPAAVCPLDEWLSDAQLAQVARIIAMPVTSFLVEDHGRFGLRWFTRAGTPVASMCGHGTLAAARLIGDKHPDLSNFVFDTPGGAVHVEREEGGFALTLPRWEASAIARPAGFAEALGAVPAEVLDAGRDLMAVYLNESDVRKLAPNMDALRAFGHRGFIATAPGHDYDCVSRFFCPTFGLGVDEDPVTGSAHCSIAPLWSGRLGKTRLNAYQASERGGELVCDVSPAAVRIHAPVEVVGWASAALGQ